MRNRTTKETRQKMIKQVSTEYEQQKGKLRNVRKRYMDKVKAIEKAKSTSEDDIKRMKKQIDGITDAVTKEMTEMMKKKRPIFKFQPFSRKQRQIFTWWADKSPVKDAVGIIADGAIRSGKTFVPQTLSQTRLYF